MSSRRNALYDIRNKEVPRSLFPSGRVKFSLGVPATPEEERAAALASRRGVPEDVQRREMMDRLRTEFAWDVLHAIQSGSIGVAEVCQRMKRDGARAVREIRQQLEKAAAAAREPAPPPIPTFGEVVDRFLEDYSRRSEAQSYATVRSRLENWRRYARDEVPLAELPLNQVKRVHVESYLRRFSNPNTRESYRLALSAVYTWSIGHERDDAEAEDREPRWSRNPASAVRGVRKPSRVTVPTDEQIRALLAVAEPYQEAYLRALVHLGLRAGELQHTRLGMDLDVETWIWKVQARLKDARCTCLQCRIGEGDRPEDEGWSPKNANGHRSFHVPEQPAGLRRAIVRMLDLYPVERGGFVFRNPRTDRVWVARSLTEDFSSLCRRAEVPYGRDAAGGIVLHDLRHACATNLVRRGVRESMIAALLGDTVKTVVDTYINPSAHDLGAGVSQGPAFDLEEGEGS